MKPNMASMMKQAQKMQAEMARVQQELTEATVEASVGGGAVKAVMTGDLRLDRVVIDPSAIDPDDIATGKCQRPLQHVHVRDG